MNFFPALLQGCDELIRNAETDEREKLISRTPT